MLKKITGSSYKDMIHSGVSNLDRHRTVINDLNVFPVPDGDTGTNMVMTIKNGLGSFENEAEDLSSVSRSFANAVVFGARGNSGVIVSQFFKGLSEGFQGEDEADAAVLIKALELGSTFAYSAVAKPVEGTILTVIKDAMETVKEKAERLDTVYEVISEFLEQAKISLANTPELLPILKKAGVVDSGGSGLVYFFEGVKKYLDGETVEPLTDSEITQAHVDYSAFHRDSNFEYGYCTEFLLQLTVAENAFSYEDFLRSLQTYGESIVASCEGDKVKVHIHTKFPEKTLAFCHGFGEFLTLKIENMSVQHTQNEQKFLCSEMPSVGNFAVVAVAPNGLLQKMFADMGADVVIMSAEAPSSQDFVEAFQLVSAKEILVFPNCSNSILSAMQAGSLYKNAKVTVLNCRSIPQCYSSLAIVDFEGQVNSVIGAVNDTTGNMYEVSVVHAAKNITYGKKTIIKNDFFAISGEDILLTGDSFEDVAVQTVKQVAEQKDCEVITLFYGQNVLQKQLDEITEKISNAGFGVDVSCIPTQNRIIDLTIAFE